MLQALKYLVIYAVFNFSLKTSIFIFLIHLSMGSIAVSTNIEIGLGYFVIQIFASIFWLAVIMNKIRMGI